MVTQDRGGIWADKMYTCKSTQWHKIQNFIAKEPKINILTKIAMQKKNIPAPNAYVKVLNWTQESAKNRDNMQRFLKAKRITFTDVILAKRKLKEPGPQSYNPKDGYRITNLPQSKHTPQMQMLDDAKFKGQQTPGWKYNPNVNVIRPKSASARIAAFSRVSGQQMKDARIKLIKKDKTNPDMGSYNPVESAEKTQIRKRLFTFGKLQKTSFVDDAIK